MHRRLEHARWPAPETVEDWSQGVPLARLQALCSYWRDEYDWRRCETALNALPQFTTWMKPASTGRSLRCGEP
ncbi:epoxide hydrolase N-terminal domain-containing protein [Novosphingobium sp. BL-52-GroH]|uniref:epoxide hydrolase N-terminal domain-containing protein n=1 Tax=Novosphingobium sp. BL-52-GroH TaxID=3349877 RepID=UPI00384DFC75